MFKPLPCVPCYNLGYCAKIAVPVLSECDLANPQIIRGIKNTAYTKRIASSDWLDYACALYRDYPGWVYDPATQREVFIDMEPLEDAPLEWWRDFCNKPCDPDIIPRVRREARARVIALGSILRAAFPVEAALWGIRPANDNEQPSQNRVN